MRLKLKESFKYNIFSILDWVTVNLIVFLFLFLNIYLLISKSSFFSLSDITDLMYIDIYSLYVKQWGYGSFLLDLISDIYRNMDRQFEIAEVCFNDLREGPQIPAPFSSGLDLDNIHITTLLLIGALWNLTKKSYLVFYFIFYLFYILRLREKIYLKKSDFYFGAFILSCLYIYIYITFFLLPLEILNFYEYIILYSIIILILLHLLDTAFNIMVDYIEKKLIIFILLIGLLWIIL